MTTQDCCTPLSLKTLSNFLPSTPPQVSIIDFLSRIMFALIFERFSWNVSIEQGREQTSLVAVSSLARLLLLIRWANTELQICNIIQPGIAVSIEPLQTRAERTSFVAVSSLLWTWLLENTAHKTSKRWRKAWAGFFSRVADGELTKGWIGLAGHVTVRNQMCLPRDSPWEKFGNMGWLEVANPAGLWDFPKVRNRRGTEGGLA